MKKIGRNLIMVFKLCCDEICECFIRFENGQNNLTQIGIMVLVERELNGLRMEKFNKNLKV